MLRENKLRHTDDLLRIRSLKNPETIMIETSGSPNGKDSVSWSWTAKKGTQIIAAENDLTYDTNSTSIVAQFLAVIKAIEWTVKNRPTNPVQVISHLEFIPKAINGEITVRSPHLIPMYKNAKRLLSKTKAVVIWGPKKR